MSSCVFASSGGRARIAILMPYFSMRPFTVFTRARARLLVVPGQIAERRALKPGFAARAASASRPFSYSPSFTRSTTSPAVGHRIPPTPHESTNSASFTSVGTSSAPSAVQGVHKSGKGPRIAGSPPAATIQPISTHIARLTIFLIVISFLDLFVYFVCFVV